MGLQIERGGTIGRHRSRRRQRTARHKPRYHTGCAHPPHHFIVPLCDRSGVKKR